MQSKCLCGTKFKNIIKLEEHKIKCKLTIPEKFHNLREYLYSVLDHSDIIINKLKKM